jgi:hypothetical protein
MLSDHEPDDFDTLNWWSKLVRVSSEETAPGYQYTNSNTSLLVMDTRDDLLIKLPLLTDPLLDRDDRGNQNRIPSPGMDTHIVSPTHQHTHRSVKTRHQPKRARQRVKAPILPTVRKTRATTCRHTVQKHTHQLKNMVLTPPTPCYSNGIITHFTCPVCLLFFGSIVDQQREDHVCQTCGFRV